MITFLMVLFVFLCVVLAISILLQQGKGDLGLGGLTAATQTFFGGSGGQSFFEKLTWILGAIFMLGSLGLAILKSHYALSSKVSDYRLPVQTTQALQPEPQNSTAEATQK
jgi:protein translocase SecG subunit